MTTSLSLNNRRAFGQHGRISSLCFHIAALILLSPIGLRAASDSSLLPEGRQKLDVLPSERNPFSAQVAEIATSSTQHEGTTEESRLRRILRAMKVGGISGKPGSQHVLLGSLIIKPGDILPPLLDNQAEVLRVVSIEDNSLVLAFIERDASTEVRRIILPLGGLEPTVTQMMYGEAFEELTKMEASGKIDVPPLTLPGVDDFLKGSRGSDLHNVTDRDVQMMGVVRDAENAEKSK